MSKEYFGQIPDIYEKKYVFIDKLEVLEKEIQELLSQNPKVIGVDLEYCTDGVFVACALLQISYINIDFVIDAYVLRENMSAILNPLFSDASIIKLVHGGDTDLSLLISDLNI